MSTSVLIDGGLSTQLEARGAVIEGSLWTGKVLIEHPEVVEAAHRDFVEAGAEIIITSSYQVAVEGFLEAGLTEADAIRAIRESVRVARRSVAGTPVKVAASVGPYGAIVHDGSEYRGDYTVDQAFLEDFHRRRLEVILSEGPDLLAVETIPTLSEVRAVAAVLHDRPDMPFWVSMSCRSATEMVSGEPIADAVTALAELPGLLAIGANCVAPEIVEGIARTIREVAEIPVIAYPNRGGEWDADRGTWEGHTPHSLAEWWPTWHEAGVAYVGGCCGLGAPAIAELSAAIHATDLATQTTTNGR